MFIGTRCRKVRLRIIEKVSQDVRMEKQNKTKQNKTKQNKNTHTQNTKSRKNTKTKKGRMH